MATLGTKQQDGKPQKKTTVCLKPISYSMELKYLGDKHVAKGASYNCNFATGAGTGNPAR